MAFVENLAPPINWLRSHCNLRAAIRIARSKTRAPKAGLAKPSRDKPCIVLREEHTRPESEPMIEQDLASFSHPLHILVFKTRTTYRISTSRSVFIGPLETLSTVAKLYVAFALYQRYFGGCGCGRRFILPHKRTGRTLSPQSRTPVCVAIPGNPASI